MERLLPPRLEIKIFEGMMGGDGKGFTEMLANIGTNFTEKMENKKGKDKKGKRRVIFEE